MHNLVLWLVILTIQILNIFLIYTSHDDKPSTGMFAVSDDVFSALGSSRGSVIS